MYALKYPEVQVAVVTPTFGDIRRVAFGGVSGILRHVPRECLLQGRGQGYNASASEIRLFNGSKIMGFSATEPDRLRGPQFHRAWCDELAAWQYPETFDQLQFGLRLGDKPQCVVTTTPKPTPMIRNLAKRSNICVTRGNTFENRDNLAPSALAMLEEKYANTRLGRQELYAEIIDDIEGALWSYAIIDPHRVRELPEMQRIVVSIDPAVTSGENTDQWARKAVEAFHAHSADKVIAEVNNGGDLVERLIRTVETGVPYKAIRSSRGKILRAEPISALYEQGKVSHLKTFSELEQQMCSYTPETAKSPDRLDALVFGLTELSASSGQAMWRVT